jgi:hypothetical protein
MAYRWKLVHAPKIYRGFDIFTDKRGGAIVKDNSKITNYRELFNVICATIYKEEIWK